MRKLQIILLLIVCMLQFTACAEKDKVEEQVNQMALRDISVQFDFDPMNTL